MTEVVEYRTEETIPELEQMLLLLFDKPDVQAIMETRKEHEYKLNKPTKRKEDCMKYINFETKLMKMIRLRHKKKGLQKNAKLVSLELALGKRLNKIFVMTIRWFPSDPRVWIAYIRFCKQMRFYSSASRVLEQMLELHGHLKPELFKLAADWELEECNCVEKARKYLLNGIHIHKNSKLLLTEAFKLELLDADRKRKECAEKNIPIDPKNALLTDKKAEVIYDCSVKALKDVELMNDLMKICAQYDFASSLQNRISNDMLEFENNEKMWDILATRELNSEDRISPKQKITNGVKFYEEAVKRLNTSQMWAYFLDALIELNSTDINTLPIFKKKLLLTALAKGSAAGKLTEKYYIVWADYLQEPEKHKRLIEVLQGAVKKIPESVTLWHKLLRAHLLKGEDKQANQVFEQGVAALTKDSMPLWKLMLQFEQTKKNSKVEEIYKKGVMACKEISGPLKPMYLEWLVLTQGIAAARKAYDTMCESGDPCLEMHKKMVYLESIQATMHLKRMRKTYTIACAQFGFSDVDVWLDHCKFEKNHGDPARLSEIYWRARSNLDYPQFEIFHPEFMLLQTIPLTSAS